MKKFLAALVAAFVLVPSLAFAQNPTVKQNGQLDSEGKSFVGVGYWTGTMWMPAMADPSGVLRVTEEYPFTNQYTSQTVATAASVFWCKFTALQPLGTVWSAHPYGKKVLHITKTATGAATASSVLIYVFTSEDNFTFRPVIITKSGATAGNWADYGDSTTQDTLKFMLPKRAGTTSNHAFSIPESFYLGRYVQLFATKTDTVASCANTVTAIWGGREQ